MTATLAQIRRALAEQVEQLTGVTTHAYAPPRITAPCIVPGRLDGERVTMDDDSRDLTINLYALVPTSNEEFQAKLDDLAEGATSIRAAIDDDPTLGLTGVRASWDSWGDYRIIPWAGVDCWGMAVPVTITRD